MKFKNRREEIESKLAAEEQKQANEKAYSELREQMKLRSKPKLHADHKLPTTRREMVAAGLMTGVTYALTPSLLSMISRKAYGQDMEMPDCTSGSSGEGAEVVPAFLQIEARGGWSAAHNVMPGKNKNATWEPLTNEAYGTLGIGSRLVDPNTMITDFGVQFQAESAFIAGVMETASPEALAKLRFYAMPQASGDDSGNNQLQVTKFVAKVQGLQYALTPIAGSFRSQEAVPDPAVSVAPLEDEAGLANLVDPGLIATRLNKDAAIEIAKASSKLSASKLAAFNAKDMPAQVQELVQCGYMGAGDLLSEYTEERLRPSSDQMMSGTPYGNLTLQQIQQDQTLGQAAIMSKLLSDGLASACSIEVGGCDYHGDSLAETDAKDRQIGNMVGIAIETAHRKGKPLTGIVSSDGSTAGQANGVERGQQRSDSGSRGMILGFAIGVDAAPEMKKGQVGAFTDSGAVDTSYLVTSNSPQLGALGAAYNYAAFAGRLAEFDQQMAAAGLSNPFNEDEYLAFAPKA
jgi:hypothetical protein